MTVSHLTMPKLKDTVPCSDETAQQGNLEELHCHCTSLQLSPKIPDHFEVMFFKMFVSATCSILLIASYRPRWHGKEPIDYLLTNNIDELLTTCNRCNFIIAGNLNQYFIHRAFDRILEVQGWKTMSFPTHSSGSSLDPVLKDFTGLVFESLGL